jgi:hypothetical protein
LDSASTAVSADDPDGITRRITPLKTQAWIKVEIVFAFIVLLP